MENSSAKQQLSMDENKNDCSLEYPLYSDSQLPSTCSSADSTPQTNSELTPRHCSSADSTPQKISSLTAGPCSTPHRNSSSTAQPNRRKRKFEMLNQEIETSMNHYTSSAIYYFTKHDIKSGTERIEKARIFLKSHSMKSLSIVKDVQMEMIAKNQSISCLTQREKFLMKKNVALEKKGEEQLDQVKAEQDFLFSDEYFPQSQRGCANMDKDGEKDIDKGDGQDSQRCDNQDCKE